MPSQTANDMTVQTGVDALLNLLKEKKKISLDEAAKKLNLDSDAVQTWVDFLVEENVVGVEYHFTKPYIYLSDDDEENINANNLSDAKKGYYKSMRKKGVSEDQLEYLWKNKLLTEAETQKQYFYETAKKKGMKNELFLWEKFLNRLIT